ncbi:MBL fold metallo-hydrolase [Peijinzhouia sedimentorum]
MKKLQYFLKSMLFLAFTLTTAVLFLGWLYTAPAYKGPVTDHFDGNKFIHPWEAPASKGFLDVLKWMTSRDQGEWREDLSSITADPIEPRIFGDELKITFINHATVLVQTQGVNILFDPIWSARTSPISFLGPKRQKAVGVPFEDLPQIDVVIYSHNHYDHLDVQSILMLNRAFSPKFIAPLGIDLFIKKQGVANVIAMDWWDSTILDEIEIIATPAQHFSGRGFFDRDKTLWCSYVIKTAGGNIFFGGDTGYASIFKEIGERFDEMRLAMVPIGAYKPRWFMSPVHTDPAEGYQIYKDVNASYGIPIHFGTFPLADDGQFDPENELKEILAKENSQDGKFKLLRNGESWEIPKIMP